MSPTDEQWIGGETDWAALAPELLDNALYSRVVRHREEDSGPRYDMAALLARPKGEQLAEVTAVVLARVGAALHVDVVHHPAHELQAAAAAALGRRRRLPAPAVAHADVDLLAGALEDDLERIGAQPVRVLHLPNND